MEKSKSELQFEQEVIEYLTRIGGVKQWEYKKEIKTTKQLWDNFKKILEQNNRARLERPLSVTEFNQVKKVIDGIATPYQAGQFLYGVNGVSEIEVSLDDGRHVFLTVFDQAQVGGGSTVYQIVNQIKRDHVIDGKKNRIFDVTLLINGLPVIQIELKKAMHSTRESFEQMRQYVAERQYTGIYSTLQILIAMTPYDIRYMANVILENFTLDFTFHWQNEVDAKPVRTWKKFCDQVLSIPMAHDLATRYMILDGTKNKESIKVMRPYQVYATRRVLDKVRKIDFNYDDGRVGYIWHTTGSGKTITSFKTAWLASRLPNVEKVVFLVDRIALTNQTTYAYQAYDPVASFEGKSGIVSDTANVSDLHDKLTKKSDKNIIVTSIQKMARYVARKGFKPIQKNILFIVDEAHRSTGSASDNEGMLESIRAALPRTAWVGYTGTPKFPDTSTIFGELIHAYTIKEAIADQNVLGFNVEFKDTIPAPSNPSEEDIDDMIKGSVYDTSEDHVTIVVKDIFDNWRKRSNDYKYNALFTVHVGGGKSSIPRAMQYFHKIIEENEKRNDRNKIKVAISFAEDTSNGPNQLAINDNLHTAIKHYNKQFNTCFDMKSVKAYTEDITRRLNKTTDDGNYLDLVIVIDQLLTGFDAPQLNTLYVDRTLKGANLIQAYSRTNRIHDADKKPMGIVVNYRWPKENEYQMNYAFAVYSDKSSADQQLTTEELRALNEEANILSKPFNKVKDELKEVIQKLSELTNNFNDTPKSEREQDEVYDYLKVYNRLMNQIKQYTVDENNNPVSAYDDPDAFCEMFGMNEDQEIMLTTVIAEEVTRKRAKREKVDISQIKLHLTHIHDVEINYDYLVDLIAKMADEVHADQMYEAENTYRDIDIELSKLDSEQERSKVKLFAHKIFTKEYVFDKYPAPNDVATMNRAIDQMQSDEIIRKLTYFIRKWGLDNCIKPSELNELITKHKVGQDDLDKQGKLTDIMNQAKSDYPAIAETSIAQLPWLKYRIEFRKSINDIADEIMKGEY